MKPFGPPSASLSSRGIPTLRGPLLTDKRIAQYIRMGRYGPEAKARLLAAEKKSRREPRAKPLALANALLKKLL